MVGFVTGVPWKRVNENYDEINVEAQNNKLNSVLNHFRKMAQLCNENLTLVYGDHDMILDAHEQLYAYTRKLNVDNNLLALLNFSDQTASTTMPEGLKVDAVMMNNYGTNPFKQGMELIMEQYQTLVVKFSEMWTSQPCTCELLLGYEYRNFMVD